MTMSIMTMDASSRDTDRVVNEIRESSKMNYNDITIYVVPGELPTIHMIKPDKASFSAIIRTHSNGDFMSMIKLENQKMCVLKTMTEDQKLNIENRKKELSNIRIFEVSGYKYRIDGFDESKPLTFSRLCGFLSDEFNCSFPWLVLKQ